MREAGDSPRRGGGGWKIALRILVTAAFLGVLASRAKGAEDVLPDDHHLRTAILLASAVLVTLIGVVLSAWRWQRVLEVFDAHIALRTLTTIYLASLFIGTVLPTTIGGDVLRVSRASSLVGSRTAFGSVALERLTGFLVLPLIVICGFAIRPSLMDEPRSWLALLVGAITLALLGFVVLAVGHPRLAGRFAERENWTRFIGAVHVGVDRLRREPRKAVRVMGTALLYQLSVITVFGLVFRALDLDVPVAAVLAFVPAVLMIQVLPISISGLGVREGAIALFLHPFGVSNAQALASGLLWFGALVVVSMLGAPAFVLARRHHAEERA
ncbi:MAG TPA: lysylphosphatidylglycerol synthase transmembrane domain-containing protein [Acidimicrobiia bacterium]|nr:lysylphosphatidylglycerol synthase transmembrane domain-containing protein [Acidimicrobiia bacterium]